MDKRGGCCITRYVGAGYDMSKVDRIMLKFRPIAPKPYSNSGGFSTNGNTGKQLKTTRTKRKYARVNHRRPSHLPEKSKHPPRECLTCNPETRSGESGSSRGSLVTLSLLPEKRERKESPAPSRQPDRIHHAAVVLDWTAPMLPRKTGSVVTVECVTDTWWDFDGKACTDEERMKRMELDACPGFVSDGRNGVWWTNTAYGEMMSGHVAREEEEERSVTLEVRESVILPVTCPAFSCWVRVTSGEGRGSPSSLTAPCDVWPAGGLHGGWTSMPLCHSEGEKTFLRPELHP